MNVKVGGTNGVGEMVGVSVMVAVGETVPVFVAVGERVGVKVLVPVGVGVSVDVDVGVIRPGCGAKIRAMPPRQ